MSSIPSPLTAKVSPAASPPATEVPLTVAGLDAARGLALMGGNTALYLAQLHTFIELRGADAQRAREKLAAGDRRGLGDLAHMLAGSAGTIGAVDLHARAHALQVAVKEQAPQQVLADAVEALAAAMVPLVTDLANALRRRT